MFLLTSSERFIRWLSINAGRLRFTLYYLEMLLLYKYSFSQVVIFLVT
jgi:hypothetical protein